MAALSQACATNWYVTMNRPKKLGGYRWYKPSQKGRSDLPGYRDPNQYIYIYKLVYNCYYPMLYIDTCICMYIIIWHGRETPISYGNETGVDKCPNCTSPNYGDIVSNIYLKVMFKIFKTGHSPTPANLPRARFDYRAQDNQKGEETAGFSKHSPLNIVFLYNYSLNLEIRNSWKSWISTNGGFLKWGYP
jgi:hypothetical protein